MVLRYSSLKGRAACINTLADVCRSRSARMRVATFVVPQALVMARHPVTGHNGGTSPMGPPEAHSGGTHSGGSQWGHSGGSQRGHNGSAQRGSNGSTSEHKVRRARPGAHNRGTRAHCGGTAGSDNGSTSVARRSTPRDGQGRRRRPRQSKKRTCQEHR